MPGETMEFSDAAEPHRRELLIHCYQMLGSVSDAQDLVQETMTRAWRAYNRFDPDLASMRTWLYRIATNACLNALDGRARRPLPSGVGQPFDDPDAPFVPGTEVPWLQPFPDRVLGTFPADPEAMALERGQLRLAFVAALQLLSAKQRAALILRDVLGFSAAEVAEELSMSVAAVNSRGNSERKDDLPPKSVDKHCSRDVPTPRRQPGQELHNAGEVHERIKDVARDSDRGGHRDRAALLSRDPSDQEGYTGNSRGDRERFKGLSGIGLTAPRDSH
jgi:RNA polymerase sigma-70 factor (ECF subfamily)